MFFMTLSFLALSQAQPSVHVCPTTQELKRSGGGGGGGGREGALETRLCLFSEFILRMRHLQ